MIGQQDGRRRVFTVDQANATLPLVRMIVSDMVRLACDVSERSERLSSLIAGRESFIGNDPYAEELAQVADQLDQDHRQLREYVDELLELGIEPTSAVEGLVDFSAVVDGRMVYLCWQLGEPEILFWHDLDGNCIDRQRLDSNIPASGQPVGAM